MASNRPGEMQLLKLSVRLADAQVSMASNRPGEMQLGNTEPFYSVKVSMASNRPGEMQRLIGALDVAFGGFNGLKSAG